MQEREHGFTLIEMLVTLTLYGLVMGVLVAGLQGGIRAWRTLERHQTANGELTRAMERLESDLRHLCAVPEAETVLSESESNGGTTTLRLCVLSPRLLQRAGRAGVWQRVEYSLRAPAEGQPLALYRACIPAVTRVPLESDGNEEILLRDVQLFSVVFAKSGEVRETWDEPKTIPQGIVITLATSGVRPQRLAVTPPCGLLRERER